MRISANIPCTVTDWDVLEAVWDYSMSECLRANSAEHPLLTTETAWNPAADRAKMCELAFEKFQVPAYYLAQSSVLSAFANGKPTALIVDIGADSSSATPVYDGYTLKTKAVHQALGGDMVSEQLIYDFSTRHGYTPVSPYLIAKKNVVAAGTPAVPALRNRPGTTESYKRVMDLVSEISGHVVGKGKTTTLT